MKRWGSLLLLLFTFSAMLASAQTTPPGTFKHIIIAVQENRTPDNLFGSAPSSVKCGMENPFEAGVDIENGGYNNTTNQVICNIPLPLNTWDQALGKIIDPDHSYDQLPDKNHTEWGWVMDYDNGNMDGFCHKYGNTCPEYSYVQGPDVAPYFDIAKKYGFANYMFQSNEGPSFEAHQFLFTGTSAPAAPGDGNHYDWDFVGENANFTDSGCPSSTGYPAWTLPTGVEIGDPRGSQKSECYTHDSLVTAASKCTGSGDSCDRGLVSWSYYTRDLQGGNTYMIWDAPAAIPQVCYGLQNPPSGNPTCGSTASTEWADHVRIPDQPQYPSQVLYSDAPIFDDLYDCKLPAISWVIPDGQWSDHPNQKGGAASPAWGPDWIGDIVNAVGGGMKNSGCNPLSTTNAKYWVQEPTLILVVWDDWGGWYDHVPPFTARQQNPHQGYTKCDPDPQQKDYQWGCGYTEGFRVPLLVVSPWTSAGYVSGPCGGSGQPCPNFGPPTNSLEFVHDFGSILGFVEWNFGMSRIYPNTAEYADINAPDWQNNFATPPLSDFFNVPLNQPRTFESITTNPNHDYNFFQTYYGVTGTTPEAPDDY